MNIVADINFYSKNTEDEMINYMNSDREELKTPCMLNRQMTSWNMDTKISKPGRHDYHKGKGKKCKNDLKNHTISLDTKDMVQLKQNFTRNEDNDSFSRTIKTNHSLFMF